MGDINNTHANGANNAPRPYRLLEANEDINDPNILWLERFSTFCQRVRIMPNWIPEVNGATSTARVTVNGHMLDVVGQGRSHKEAKARLVRRLEEVHHDILRIPLLPQFANPPANENALPNGGPAGPVQANGDPAQANGGLVQVDGGPVQVDGDSAQVNDGPQVNGDLTQVNGV
ncbi:unnamed protein product [Rhizoctonia solani]|uniref:Uncharacterized protein n=1 Tax=Rhizoctonia solani TaxID=456999 RepID=A0A8H3DF39_9AGAM|nr:unnamed protein product [Rhizoctonia solani]